MDNYKTVSKLLFPEEETRTNSQKFDDLLRNQLYSMRNERLRILNPENPQQITDNENYTQIAEFIKKHVLAVGKEQAVRDFQSGLNFLHKDLKEPLKEDGDFEKKLFVHFMKFLNITILKL